LNDVVEDAVYVRRVLLNLLRKLPYLIGNDCKAPSSFSCPCGFNGGVEGKQVRLIGYILDYSNDVPDALRLPVKLLQLLSRLQVLPSRLLDRQ